MIVKFCGMGSEPDLELASALGARMCGFIFHAASPRFVAPARARTMPSFGLERVGVFVSQEQEEIASFARMARLDWIQLHAGQSIACARNLGAHRIIRVLWPARYPSVEELCADAERHADACAMFLLDAGQTGGGSGQTIAWHRLKNLELGRPWILAGGIGAANVATALDSCIPFGLDINSGVEESPGKKSHEKMKLFIRTLNKIMESRQ